MTEQDGWAEIEDMEADWIPGPPTEGEIEAARQERAVLDVDEETQAIHDWEREAGLSDAQIAELDGPPKLDSFRAAMARTQLTDVDDEGNQVERYPDFPLEPDQQQAQTVPAEQEQLSKDHEYFAKTLSKASPIAIEAVRDEAWNAGLDFDVEDAVQDYNDSLELALIDDPHIVDGLRTAQFMATQTLAAQSMAQGVPKATAYHRAAQQTEAYIVRRMVQAKAAGQDPVAVLKADMVQVFQELYPQQSQGERDAATIQAGQRAASRSLGRSGRGSAAPAPQSEADIFRIKDPEEFDKAFAAWVEDQTG